MRLLILTLITSLTIFACNNQVPQQQATVKGKMLEELPIVPDSLKGTFTGSFRGTPLSLTLNYASHNHASGYNVHKGLLRNVSGTVQNTPEGLRLQLSEPGNNPYDGSFDLLVDAKNFTVKGKWTPLKKGEEATFTLKKQAVQNEDEMYENIFIDTLENTLTLNADGSCVYNYRTDTTNTAQQLSLRGNYSKDSKALTVFWQKNNVFASQKSVFKIIETKPDPDADYTEKSLKGEGRLFTQLMY